MESHLVPHQAVHRVLPFLRRVADGVHHHKVIAQLRGAIPVERVWGVQKFIGVHYMEGRGGSAVYQVAFVVTIKVSVELGRPVPAVTACAAQGAEWRGA